MKLSKFIYTCLKCFGFVDFENFLIFFLTLKRSYLLYCPLNWRKLAGIRKNFVARCVADGMKVLGWCLEFDKVQVVLIVMFYHFVSAITYYMYIFTGMKCLCSGRRISVALFM